MEECTLVYNVALQMRFFHTRRPMLDDRKIPELRIYMQRTWDTGDSPAAGMLQEEEGGGGRERGKKRRKDAIWKQACLQWRASSCFISGYWRHRSD